MKIELKHLAPYLPYEISVKLFGENGLSAKLKLTTDMLNAWNTTEDSFNIKPILRPLSDLLKYELKVNEHYINQFISEKHKVFVLADCVYSEVYFNKKPYLPLFESEYFFYVNSFSKLLSITGWRVGYLICSKKHIAEMRLIHDYTGLSSPSILQEAIALYLDKYDFGKKYVTDLRKKMRTSFGLLSGKLKDCGFEIPNIEGGYFIWAKLPKGFSDCLKFSMDLYDTKKVATVPGIHFSDEGKKFVRFNIARPAGEIEDAGKRIKEFVKEVK